MHLPAEISRHGQREIDILKIKSGLVWIITAVSRRKDYWGTEQSSLSINIDLNPIFITQLTGDGILAAANADVQNELLAFCSYSTEIMSNENGLQTMQTSSMSLDTLVSENSSKSQTSLESTKSSKKEKKNRKLWYELL